MSFPTNVDLTINILADKVNLTGIVHLPKNASAIVLFAHGSGSGRFSPRNQFVAHVLQRAQIATLLFDLFTPNEEEIDENTSELRFNIDFLATRLIAVTNWAREEYLLENASLGYFGASTGGGAALVAAASEADVKAVVSRGGRPDLAGSALSSVKAPTLLIVGGDDTIVIDLNKKAMQQMTCEKKLEIVPGATHLFEEPGKLEIVADLARDWFVKYL